MPTMLHDEQAWPIVITRFFGSAHSAGDIDQAYRTWTDQLRRGKCVLILDLTRGNMASTAPERARLADWTKEQEYLLRSRQVASIMIVQSAMVRGIITAVHWLRPPPSPAFVVANMAEALSFAVARLREQGLDVDNAALGRLRNLGSAA